MALDTAYDFLNVSFRSEFMPVTIKDIAKVAGVTHSTVSRALNGNPMISEATAKLVQRVAAEMGYVPSAVAQNLHSRRTKSIGMVLTTISDPFLARIVEGVEQVARDAGYSLFLSTSYNHPDKEINVIETLYRRRVDAIIIASMWVGSTYRAELSRIKIPIVLINHLLEGDGLHSVAVDDVQGARLAVKHLIDLGHRRISFVKSLDRPSIYVENRIEGYRLAHLEAALPMDPRLILTPEGDGDVERGKRALELLRETKATAAFCYNDLTAIGLMKACHELGVRVPTDLSIVGFDDLEIADYVSPSLTTIHQPRLELGQTAMRMALAMLEEKAAITDQTMRCQLKVRQSTAAPEETPLATARAAP